ncbi:STAS domain-containing protein [Microbispora sp. RL4-1S]|uniref:STAS domain-containing protein n=1 Tax=Microbispora oryzae TaxID=2806554 RepID=A0A940WM96_9ACTN|nr:STAS domain-containing protein [Microbispora oryzae]MBP2707528.1 STAS domain-containing protein [Microbispora oryzae]
MLRIQITWADTTIRVAVGGDLDRAGASELRARLRGTLDAVRARHLELDLAEVLFIDCAGSRSLLWVSDRVRAGGGTATFTRPRRRVLRLLRLLQYDRVLQIGAAGAPVDIEAGPADG